MQWLWTKAYQNRYLWQITFTPKGAGLQKASLNFRGNRHDSAMCKACCGGSSVGVTIVESEDEYNKALRSPSDMKMRLL